MAESAPAALSSKIRPRGGGDGDCVGSKAKRQVAAVEPGYEGMKQDRVIGGEGTRFGALQNHASHHGAPDSFVGLCAPTRGVRVEVEIGDLYLGSEHGSLDA